ncbi:hypothetical protein Q4561_13945 [Alteromonas sp. 1_MG-2023]|uniref:hypothetical protein n=1 Tax=Alteromonas sp. 1_MG-2023 TaxID=3062669 RepID=UPI0026E1DD21|nr:hypothetical protein [Alteromonas sp. 1_MG-2023]MDO6568170.1 hypothetical protein [Alteromonas sp. 1_MG-2023]
MRNLILIVLFIPLICLAGEQELVEAFFSPNGIEDKEAVYSGEMLEYHLNRPTLGESLPYGMSKEYRLIESTSSRKIYAVSLTKDGNTQDWYAYLTKSPDSWKLSAIRNLALPRFFFIALQKIEAKKQRSKEDDYRYQNMLLTLKSDSELKRFLKSNLTTLEMINSLAENAPEQANQIAGSLNLNKVDFEAETGITNINIGGILDNSVGYLYVPKAESVPDMSDDNYIYLEKVQGNWYLYKTT